MTSGREVILPTGEETPYTRALLALQSVPVKPLDEHDITAILLPLVTNFPLIVDSCASDVVQAITNRQAELVRIVEGDNASTSDFGRLTSEQQESIATEQSSLRTTRHAILGTQEAYKKESQRVAQAQELSVETTVLKQRESAALFTYGQAAFLANPSLFQRIAFQELQKQLPAVQTPEVSAEQKKEPTRRNTAAVAEANTLEGWKKETGQKLREYYKQWGIEEVVKTIFPKAEDEKKIQYFPSSQEELDLREDFNESRLIRLRIEHIPQQKGGSITLRIGTTFVSEDDKGYLLFSQIEKDAERHEAMETPGVQFKKTAIYIEVNGVPNVIGVPETGLEKALETLRTDLGSIKDGTFELK